MLSEEDDLLHAWYPLRTSTDARAFSPRNPRKNKNRRRRSTGFRLANSRARFRLLESRADAYRAARAEDRGEDGCPRVGARGSGRGGVVRSRVRCGGARALRGRLASGLARQSARGHTGPGPEAGRALRGAHGPVVRVVRGGLASERD